MTTASDKIWDVIVIGTGIGGGTIGRALAEAGLSVLFLEKGKKGLRCEQNTLRHDVWDATARATRGYWPKPMKAKVNGIETEFFAPLGAGVGGSSVFYAAALECPEPHDLDDTAKIKHPTGGWPVSYAEFAPYFRKAQTQYHINGTPDPLSKQPTTLENPPAPTEGETALFAALKSKGLHPYRGHMAIKNVEDCQSCLGFKCPKACKMDGRSAGVEPALATGHAELLDECDVTHIHSSSDQVSHIAAMHKGTEVSLRARRYILSAGALRSPHLLLKSRNGHWPDGLGNTNGLVGCNLMFHLNEMFALRPKGASVGTSKAIALRDLYTHNATRLGMIQALGIEASYGEIVHYLNMIYDRSFLRRLKGLRHLTRLPAAIATKLFGSASLFVGIFEDLPYPENRVILDQNPDTITLEYRFHPELMARRSLFRKQIKTRLRGLKPFFLSHQPELNFGHPSGTLVFGHDPRSSVLNAQCRLHGVKNLYAVDASFMPTSMGVNPSLTIAANALRVAAHLIDELKVSDD
ncbi:GMC oxidoreductase [Cochlodiniinecator piscidefendens]|uniref:GMC oxidoreductase n=1 Tax=Cochlodiniinecator piscidefendens TaxID=2715756 RepID=UPI001409B4BF|nr:GMC family oxidoreductase [Cochlodiniinecator piscidefendens]